MIEEVLRLQLDSIMVVMEGSTKSGSRDHGLESFSSHHPKMDWKQPGHKRSFEKQVGALD